MQLSVTLSHTSVISTLSCALNRVFQFLSQIRWAASNILGLENRAKKSLKLVIRERKKPYFIFIFKFLNICLFFGCPGSSCCMWSFSSGDYGLVEVHRLCIACPPLGGSPLIYIKTNFFIFTSGSDVKESACNVGDLGSIPGSGRSPGEGNGYPLQYSYLKNSMDRGAWRLQSMGSQRVGHNWATKHVKVHFIFIWQKQAPCHMLSEY